MEEYIRKSEIKAEIKEKLKKYLESVLISDELAKKIRAAFDAHDVGTGVERSDFAAEVKSFHNVAFDEYVIGEIVAAVCCSVTNSFDLAHILDTADLGVCQSVNNDLDRNGVVGHGEIANDLVAISVFVFDAAVDTDAFTKTLCENGFGSGVHKLIFERGASRIQNQNFHPFFPFSRWVNRSVQYSFRQNTVSTFHRAPRRSPPRPPDQCLQGVQRRSYQTWCDPRQGSPFLPT